MTQPLSDVEWIFVVLTTLYLVEAVPWIRPGGAPFSSAWGRFRRPGPSPRVVGNDSGGLHTCGLAPFDATFIAESIPVAVAPPGVFGYVSPSPLEIERLPVCETFFTWAELEQLRRCDRDLMVGGQLLCRLRSAATAQCLLRVLRELAATTEEARRPGIERWVASMFDLNATRQSVAAWRSATRILRFSATLLFLWIFPFGLARYYDLLPGRPDLSTLVLYLAGFFLLWWYTNGLVYLSHRRLQPLERASRWKAVFTAFVSPAVPLRAADHLAREQFALVHPLTLAAALSAPAEIREVVAISLRDLRYPRLPEAPPEASATALATIREYRRIQLQFATRLAEELGFDAESLVAPPVPEHPDSESYCPRCVQEYTRRDAHCLECGNRPTVPFASESSRSTFIPCNFAIHCGGEGSGEVMKMSNSGSSREERRI